MVYTVDSHAFYSLRATENEECLGKMDFQLDFHDRQCTNTRSGKLSSFRFDSLSRVVIP